MDLVKLKVNLAVNVSYHEPEMLQDLESHRSSLRVTL